MCNALEELKKYIPLVKFLSTLLGENCEVVLHDISNPDHSIIAIENNHVSGRQVGGALTDLVLRALRNKEYQNADFISNYVVVTKSNRICQASSYFIRDENNKVIGALCVNIDVTDLLLAKDFLDKFIRIKPPKGYKSPLVFQPKDYLQGQETNDVGGENEVLEHLLENSGDVVKLLIEKVLNEIPIPVERLSPEEKIEIVRELNEQGLFLFKGGVSELAKYLKVSEATIYRYLNKIKEDD